MDGERLLQAPEVAERLRISRSNTWAIMSGRKAGLPPLPHVRIGRRIFVREESLNQWIKQVEEMSKCKEDR
jgi:predicted DNA-binding transcriptional regulator AlpA